LDILDIFGNGEEPRYNASLWLYRTTNGATSFGESFLSVEEAEEALKVHTSAELSFTRELILDGVIHYASQAYKEKVDMAVVIQIGTGDVVSRALLPSKAGVNT